MNNKTTIYVVRHGQSEGNLTNDTAVIDALNKYGPLETPLTELGKKQAQEIAAILENIPFDAIFSSDMMRAKQTADIIAAKRDMNVITEATIRERDYGRDFFMLNKNQRNELKKAMNDLNDEEKLNYRFFPNTESPLDAVMRFKQFLLKIIPLYRGKNILVVNHGNVMRSFLIHIKYLKYDELPHESINNCGYYVLESDGITFSIIKTYGVNKKII
jgi:broad specificity phosphatase PhoE